MIKYYALFNRIEKKEVIRQTDKYIYINERQRELKKTEWYCYVDTFEEAKEFLINMATTRIEKYKNDIEYLKINIEKETKKLNALLEVKEHVG